ncbi:MAG: hypothetical protein K6G75_05795 [Lachnospiraceae bacterium]|nr:hypothetical protein [Lachnospiraceae bacterium]
MEMTIKESNGSKIAEILEKIGPDSAIIKTDRDWDLRIYYSSKDENSMTIEMCSSINLDGDTLFDPLMTIDLILDNEGKIHEAVPKYYMSQTIFCTEEIYSKDNPDCWNPKLCEKSEELDKRLAEWLESIQIQKYLTEGKIIKA